MIILNHMSVLYGSSATLEVNEHKSSIRNDRASHRGWNFHLGRTIAEGASFAMYGQTCYVSRTHASQCGRSPLNVFTLCWLPHRQDTSGCGEREGRSRRLGEITGQRYERVLELICSLLFIFRPKKGSVLPVIVFEGLLMCPHKKFVAMCSKLCLGQTVRVPGRGTAKDSGMEPQLFFPARTLGNNCSLKCGD